MGPLQRFAVQEIRSYDPEDALLEGYLDVAAELGTERAVFVQPSGFGMDNSCLLEATARRRGCARAVVVFDHMVHMDPQSGPDEVGFCWLLDALGKGIAWVKLSGGFFLPSGARAKREVARYGLLSKRIGVKQE